MKFFFDKETEIAPIPKLLQGKQNNMLTHLEEEGAVQMRGPLHPYLPQVFDPDTLAAQILQDPEAIYLGFHELMTENASLSMEIQKKNLEQEKLKELYTKTITQYEELCNIGATKQLILWQFIHRLQMASESSRSPTSATSEVLTAVEILTNSGTGKRGSTDSTKLDPNAVSL